MIRTRMPALGKALFAETGAVSFGTERVRKAVGGND